MLKKLVFVLVFFLFGINSSYGLDWKTLHEKADRISLNDALEKVKAKPNSMEDLYVLGLGYLNLHKDQEAEVAFNKILSQDPKIIEAQWGLAEVFRRQHHYDKSEELLTQVLKERPDFSPSYITLAYIRYTQMKFQEAVALSEKVLSQDDRKVDCSNITRAYLLRGGTKGMIAHYGGALSKIINGTAVLPSLKAAQKLQPNSAGVQFGLGSFYLLAPSLAGGDKDKAEGYLKKAIEVDPLLADAYVRLGQFYKIKGDDAKHKECIARALAIDPQNELALDVSSGACKFICLDTHE